MKIPSIFKYPFLTYRQNLFGRLKFATSSKLNWLFIDRTNAALRWQSERNYMSTLIWETQVASHHKWLGRNFFPLRFCKACWLADSFITSHRAQHKPKQWGWRAYAQSGSQTVLQRIILTKADRERGSLNTFSQTNTINTFFLREKWIQCANGSLRQCLQLSFDTPAGKTRLVAYSFFTACTEMAQMSALVIRMCKLKAESHLFQI